MKTRDSQEELQQVRRVPSLGEEQAARLRLLMDQFLDRSEADSLLVIDRGGVLVGYHDSSGSALQIDALAALAAGAFAATRELARRLGEEEFKVLYHQGSHRHILMHAVKEDAIAVAVFSNTTTVGLVRLVLSQAAKDLGSLLEEARMCPDIPEDCEFRPAQQGLADIFGERDEES
jgi:predicted regulator of Ras-like GTPase activity (Roadblock/LC7/MglB family)